MSYMSYKASWDSGKTGQSNNLVLPKIESQDLKYDFKKLLDMSIFVNLKPHSHTGCPWCHYKWYHFSGLRPSSFIFGKLPLIKWIFEAEDEGYLKNRNIPFERAIFLVSKYAIGFWRAFVVLETYLKR